MRKGQDAGRLGSYEAQRRKAEKKKLRRCFEFGRRKAESKEGLSDED
jgi:hypothetical protein